MLCNTSIISGKYFSVYVFMQYDHMIIQYISVIGASLMERNIKYQRWLLVNECNFLNSKTIFAITLNFLWFYGFRSQNKRNYPGNLKLMTKERQI